MVASKKHNLSQNDATSNNNNNCGHSLLSFMKLASNKVKTALEKPNSFKRNINHRRFLQKQFKALVKSPASEKAPLRKHLHTSKEHLIKEDIDIGQKYRHSCRHHPYPRPNSLHFGLQYYSTRTVDMPQARLSGSFSRSGRGNCARRPREGMPCEGDVPMQTLIPEIALDETEDESFLTGEELTEAIEMKDLFIPETDLTQYLNIKDSLELLALNKTNPDFDRLICNEFMQYKRR